ERAAVDGACVGGDHRDVSFRRTAAARCARIVYRIERPDGAFRSSEDPLILTRGRSSQGGAPVRPDVVRSPRVRRDAAPGDGPYRGASMSGAISAGVAFGA